jgi:quaternary ammonium compound-resistance protein SugE
MAWFYLLSAGVFEIVWAFAMKQSDGFTRPVPVTVMIVGMLLSFWLLALSMKSLPLGTAYTIWTGIGAVGAFVIGIAVLGEHLSFPRVLAACLIVSGLVLMKVSSPSA